MNRRERIRHTHRYLNEDSCPAERATKSHISTADVVHVPPPRPLRVQPGCKGPVINRELKPGRLPKSASGHTSHRFSLDLESQDFDRRLKLSGFVTDSHTRKAQHHEWPPVRGETAGSFTCHSKPAQGLEEQNWYVGAVGRVEAEHALHLVNREGAFLVRDCSKNTTYEPLVLAVFYDKRVFNIQIRFSEEISKYTLGTGLRTNDRFDSVTDIIKFHSIFPIVLIEGRKTSGATNQKRQCVLMYPITKQDLTELLT
ncbi:Cytokine-dependent hematopoietic cell linker [Anabarilius grahami]|uniref:Cytokine-dependent hematopoietic cell linker n=1 Tax=Anabarilius grahami TaxID=495550 RepID=A0A3N0Z5R2_ANAGA|nr:Cytokine-dependent hematopoietic cell linker [Anabarilius grahami]